MRIEQFITLGWAKELEKEIADDAIKSLTEMSDGLMSGDDSRLNSIWEELCVQVQGEESIFFEEYIDIVQDFIGHALSNKQRIELMALWLATDEGFDWVYDHFSEADSDESLPLDLSVIVEKITSIVLSQASDFESETVYNYLHQLGDGDEEDEGEEDDDEDEEACDENEGEDERSFDENKQDTIIDENVLALDKIADLKIGLARKEIYACPPDRCDYCKLDFASEKYFVDAREKNSAMWGCMCPRCFYIYGESIGWGSGQLYLNRGNDSWLLVGGFR